jgi:SAM-dependent methyltransferase
MTVLSTKAIQEVRSMSKEIFINLEKEAFLGNVLDIGIENHGIVYDLCKVIDDNITIDYISGEEDKEKIEKNFFDSCVIFFSLYDLKSTYSKNDLIKDIYTFLKKDGIIYIWDVDKPRFKSIYFKLKVVVPRQGFKEVKINARNPLIDASCKTTCKLLKQYFKIIDLKQSDNIYYIKAQKKGCILSENFVNSH